MEWSENPYRGAGMPGLDDVPWPASDAAAPRGLLARCPEAGVTPLIEAQDLAADLGLAQLMLKDERARMGLGSFKALGAAYVIARAGRADPPKTYMTASAGNHGLSLAAGAQAFGQKAVIYISEQVPETFAARIETFGAEVRRGGAIYEDSMEAAAKAAAAEGAVLLSDSSWPGYFDLPHGVMEGYLVLMAEAFEQMHETPSHIFLQAGVGGLAGACAAAARAHWGESPQIIVVEPEVAPALAASITAGRSVVAPGPVSAMGRLDCKEPSLIALKGLARDADRFMTITEEEGQAGAALSAQAGFASTPSGAAGFAGALAAKADLSPKARVFAILSEGVDG